MADKTREGFPFRVRYSQEFYKSFQYRRAQANRQGTALRRTRDGRCYIILWDGRKTGKPLGMGFVERVSDTNTSPDTQK